MRASGLCVAKSTVRSEICRARALPAASTSPAGAVVSTTLTIFSVRGSSSVRRASSRPLRTVYSPYPMRVAPAASARGFSVEMPGAETGRAPIARLKACSLAEGIAVTSYATTSLRARPSQSTEVSPLRFSKRRMAMRSGPLCRDCRAQPVRMIAASSPPVAALQYTRLQGQQFFEFRHLAEGSERGIVAQLLAVLVALLDGLTEVLQSEIVASALHVERGHEVVIFGAIGHGALLQQDAVGAVVLEDFGIELERGAEFFNCRLDLVAREVSHAEIAVHRGLLGRDPERLAVLIDRAAIALLRIVDGADVVDRLVIIGLELDGGLIAFQSLAKLLQLVIRNPHFVAQHRVFWRAFSEGLDGFTILFARHEDVAAHFGRELRFLRRGLWHGAGIENRLGKTRTRKCEGHQQNGAWLVNHICPLW